MSLLKVVLPARTFVKLPIGCIMVSSIPTTRTCPSRLETREITKLYHPLVLRYLMMSTHYWDPVNYSQEQLEFASESVFYLYKTSLDCEKALFSFREKNPVIAKCKNIRLTLEAQRCIDKLMNDFYAKMSDDFRTPNILNAAAL